jgi:hypothetical protein
MFQGRRKALHIVRTRSVENRLEERTCEAVKEYFTELDFSAIGGRTSISRFTRFQAMIRSTDEEY